MPPILQPAHFISCGLHSFGSIGIYWECNTPTHNVFVRHYKPKGKLRIYMTQHGGKCTLSTAMPANALTLKFIRSLCQHQSNS